MPQVGTGITITFASGFLAEILNVNDGDISRPSIKASHATSAQDEFLPGKLVDTGQLEAEIAFDPAASPPIDQAPETVTINYPKDATVQQWARTGFMTAFRTTAPISPQEDRMTATCVIKFTGALTITQAP